MDFSGLGGWVQALCGPGLILGGDHFGGKYQLEGMGGVAAASGWHWGGQIRGQV